MLHSQIPTRRPALRNPDDVARRSAALQFDNNAAALIVDSEEVDDAAVRCLYLASHKQEALAQNVGVRFDPIFEPALAVNLPSAYWQKTAIIYCPKTN